MVKVILNVKKPRRKIRLNIIENNKITILPVFISKNKSEDSNHNFLSSFFLINKEYNTLNCDNTDIKKYIANIGIKKKYIHSLNKFSENFYILNVNKMKMNVDKYKWTHFFNFYNQDRNIYQHNLNGHLDKEISNIKIRDIYKFIKLT